MSFLVEDGDQQATLEVALALIDAYAGDGVVATTDSAADSTDTATSSSSSQLVTNSPTASASGSSSDDSNHTHADSSARPRMGPSKKARNNAGAVARHREKKKAEAVWLREQVRELEATLAKLHTKRLSRAGALQSLIEQQRAQASSDSNSSTAEGSDRGGRDKHVAIQPKQVSRWLSMASLQVQERHKAENLNAQLRDAVARQLKVIKALEEVFSKHGTGYGLDLLLESQKEDLRSDFLLAQEDRLFQELRSELQKMYFVSDGLFDCGGWTEATDALSCTTQVKADPTAGVYVEVRSSTPLQTPFKLTGQVMWKRMCDLAVGHDRNYHVTKRELTATSFRKSYKMIINGPDGQPLELRGVSYVEMVEEASRMMWMWRSLVVTTDSTGPRFVEKGWTMSESANSLSPIPQSASVYRTCYQVLCDSSGERSAQDPQNSLLIETVLRTLGSRTRAHQQYQQNTLLDEFAGLNLHRPAIQLFA